MVRGSRVEPSEELGKPLLRLVGQITEKRGWPRESVETLAWFDSETMHALDMLLQAEEQKMLRSYLQANDKYEAWQARVRALMDLRTVLMKEWTSLYEESRR